MDMSHLNANVSPAHVGAPKGSHSLGSSPQAKLLLTGATGFLGTEIILQCISRDLPVHTVGRSESVSGPRIKHFEADLVSDDVPTDSLVGCDQVLHVAGLAHQFGKKGDDRQRFFDVNARGAQKVAIAAAKAGVKHFVLISSVGVYGQGSGLRDETANCNPKSHYAESKHLGESLVSEVCRDHEMQLTILRMATLYGENDRGNTQRLIRGIEQRTLPFFGRGENRKSLVHVQDAAKACVTVVQSWRGGQTDEPVATFNVAGESATMKEIVRGIRVALNKRPKFVHIPMVFVRAPLNMVRRVPVIGKIANRVLSALDTWSRDDAYDGSKFAQTYRFAFDVNLQDGLARQTQSYILNHQKGGMSLARKRVFDIIAAIGLLIVLAIPMMVVAILVKLTSKGPIVYFSNRVGKDERIFAMPKFRTMRTDTPQLATHLLTDAENWLTPIGSFLRKSSLDELPQLFSVLMGHMSFVGPRPALFNQYDLMALRDEAGVARLRPGITGWAQINGRDELAIPEKVVFDQQYLFKRGTLFDAYVTIATGAKVFRRDGVRSADESTGISDWLTLHQASPSPKVVLTTPDLSFIVNEAARTAFASSELPTILSVRNPTAVGDLLQQFKGAGHIWVVQKSAEMLFAAVRESLDNPAIAVAIEVQDMAESQSDAAHQLAVNKIREEMSVQNPGPPKPHFRTQSTASASRATEQLER